MTYSSTFMSDFIRGLAATGPQAAEDGFFVQDVASFPGALAIPDGADCHCPESPGRVGYRCPVEAVPLPTERRLGGLDRSLAGHR